MSLSKISGAAVLLALAPSALALGAASVVNNCGFPIYYASVGQSQHATMQQMQGSYSQQYGQAGNGISIKLAPSADGHVSQFEFTWADGKINYDLSNIDGNPFAAGGMRVVPSMQGDSANPTCVVIDCPAGDATCTAAYNAPDDVRTHVCSEDADLTLTMCPDGSSGAPTDAGSDSSNTTSTDTGVPSPVASEPATDSGAATPVASQPAAETTYNDGWGKPPAKRAAHVHQRVHSRAFRG